MTIDERSEGRRLLWVLRTKVMAYVGLRKPSIEGQNAIKLAVESIEAVCPLGDRRYERARNLLKYHAEHLDALLGKDDGTMEALRIGADALEKRLEMEAEADDI